MRRILLGAALLFAAAGPAAAQVGPRISLQPYVGYGFYGTLPDNGPRLLSTVAYGGRAAYQFSEQFALFGNFQRSEPEVENLGGGKARVDHWSAGVEFSYVPRGGAEGMLPVLLEAGLGQTRYDWNDLRGGSDNDFAVNLGIGSSLALTRNFAIRYGANDYLSNYEDRGVTNQIFVQVGGELRF